MDAVITMPLNPRHFKKMGFYSIFAYAEYLSQLHKIPSVLVVNKRGIVDVDEMAQALAQRLQDFSLEPTAWWHDTSIDQARVSDLIEQLLSRCVLEESQEKIVHCGCGKIQYLSGATLRKTKTTLLSPDGMPLCCSKTIETTEVLALVTQKLKAPDVYPTLYPTWARKEFDWIYSELSGKRLLVSRVGAGGFLIRSPQGNSFWLDNDIVVSFLPWFLENHGIKGKHLVSGISTMRQVALMSMFMSSLGLQPFEEVHFLPRVNCKLEDFNSLLKDWGAVRLKNALLWCAVSGRQEISFDESLVTRMTPEIVMPQLDRLRHRKSLCR